MSQRVCIYCVERKPASAFNREHVMLAAFGMFEGNLVLDCVCWDCNDFFSKHVDLKFARDSVEGFFRYVTGVKSTADYISLGSRSTTRVEFAEGESAGATGYLAANPEGGPELRVEFTPQIGFSVTEEGRKTWFAAHALPTRDGLSEHGFDPKAPFFLHTRGMAVEDARPLLEAKGYKVTNDFRSWYPPDERVATTTVGVISHPEMRAAAKIAMNYLAYVTSPGLVRAVQFEDVRRFVRHGRGLPRVSVTENNLQVLGKDGQPVRGHYVAVQTQPNGVVLAQVSVFLKLKYILALSTVPFAVSVPRVSSAHFWDIDARIVKPFQMPPWIPGPQLPPSARTANASPRGP